MAAISVLMEGDTPGFMRVFQDVAAALRLSLKENHTQQEVDKIFDALGFSTEPYTPCFNAILALIGRDVPEPAESEDAG